MTLRHGRTIGLSLVSALAAYGGGDSVDGTVPSASAQTGGPLDDLTCEGVLADPFFEGNGSTGLEIRSGRTIGCTMDFQAQDRVLTKLGMQSDCQPEASIAVAVDIDTQAKRWTLDPHETALLDNGECVEATRD